MSHTDFQAIIDEVSGLGQATVERIVRRQQAVEEQQSAGDACHEPSERRQVLFQRLRSLFGV
jgi:hypothetical protein